MPPWDTFDTLDLSANMPTPTNIQKKCISYVVLVNLSKQSQLMAGWRVSLKPKKNIFHDLNLSTYQIFVKKCRKVYVYYRFVSSNVIVFGLKNTLKLYIHCQNA